MEKHLPFGEIRLPRNAEFHVWIPYLPWERGDGLAVDLVDSQSKSVPASVEAFDAPEPSDHGWGWRQILTIHPFSDLAPGSYRVVLRGDRGERIEISAERPEAAPPAPAGLRASAVVEECVQDTRGDCSPIYGPCTFARLEFHQPKHWDEHFFYELGWSAVAAEDQAPARQGLLRGLTAKEDGESRVILVPTWAFEGLQPRAERLEVELRGVDHAGRRSEPARAVADVAAFLQQHPIPQRERTPALTLERRYTDDLWRFKSAAAADAQGLFTRLEPVVPSPVGQPYDQAFQRVVLGRDGRAFMRGQVGGTTGRAEVVLPVMISAGVVHPQVSLGRLTEVLTSLPPLDHHLQKMRILFEDDWAEVQLQSVGWGDVQSRWYPDRREGPMKDWVEHERAVALVSADPIYRALVAAHGEPSARGFGSGQMDVRFGDIVALFQCRGANVGELRLNCPFTACRVGELSPVMDAIEGVFGAGMRKRWLQLLVERSGSVDVLLHPPGSGTATRFKAELGKAELVSVPTPTPARPQPSPRPSP